MTYNYEDEDSDEDLIGVSEGIIKGIHGHIDEGFDENSKEGWLICSSIITFNSFYSFSIKNSSSEHFINIHQNLNQNLH